MTVPYGDMGDEDLFYFCHIHRYLGGRIKLTRNSKFIQPEEHEPALTVLPPPPSHYDAQCGTYGTGWPEFDEGARVQSRSAGRRAGDAHGPAHAPQRDAGREVGRQGQGRREECRHRRGERDGVHEAATEPAVHVSPLAGSRVRIRHSLFGRHILTLFFIRTESTNKAARS